MSFISIIILILCRIPAIISRACREFSIKQKDSASLVRINSLFDLYQNSYHSLLTAVSCCQEIKILACFFFCRVRGNLIHRSTFCNNELSDLHCCITNRSQYTKNQKYKNFFHSTFFYLILLY